MQFNKGEHGFDNQVMDMKPFFRAVGPDFQKNLLVGPFETVNVYPLMCHLLGINPEVNDGHLDNTKHMLVPKTNTGDNDSKIFAMTVYMEIMCWFIYSPIGMNSSLTF